MLLQLSLNSAKGAEVIHRGGFRDPQVYTLAAYAKQHHKSLNMVTMEAAMVLSSVAKYGLDARKNYNFSCQ